MKLFTVEERQRVHDRVLGLASSDKRVVAGAVVGSLAHGNEDRWSDLDLTFAVATGVPVSDVLDDWARTLKNEFAAAQLFDLPAGSAVYRVFLFPGCLQVDLSFTPEQEFGADGPSFRLLFGESVEKPHAEAPSPATLFGYAVHHALRTRVCIERGRYWQAEYWMSAVRDYALNLACKRRDLPVSYGRGFDRLPAETRAAFQDAFARSLEPEELLRALRCAISGLVRESEEVPDLPRTLESELTLLSRSWADEASQTIQNTRLDPSAGSPGGTHSPEFAIRLAREDDVGVIPEIEREASTRFADRAAELGIPVNPRVTPPEALRKAQQAGRLWVASGSTGRIVGFALVRQFETVAHLEELDVLPSHGQRGVGSALLGEVCSWAEGMGLSAVTLSTFRDVAWNGPFYRRRGFSALKSADLSPGLWAVVEAEEARGLRTDLRVIMRREIKSC